MEGNRWFHRHGGAPEYDFRRLDIPPRPVVDFSVNVNALGPPPEVIDRWNELAAEIASYPSIDGEGVRRFYQHKFKLPPECVLPGNGSVELIYLVPRALRLGHVAVLSPSFYEYVRAARLAGAQVSFIRLSAENDFALPPLQELEKHLSGAQALFLGNPNNPTGTLIPRDVILQLAERHPDKWFLVDEAFIQFVENSASYTLMRSEYLRPNVVVFHSLTKFYALSGLRMGAALGHPATISRLRAFKEPWSVNAVAERVAGVLCRCRDYEAKTRRLVSQERQRLFHNLKEMPGIQIFAPVANFFLARWTATGNLDDLLRGLLSRGFYVRDCRNFPGLEENYFRFAIRQPHENDRLVKNLVACVTELK